jgi:hypothetical protein
VEVEAAVEGMSGKDCTVSGLGTSSLICFSISASDMGWMGGGMSVSPLRPAGTPFLSRGAGRDWEKRFCKCALLESEMTSVLLLADSEEPKSCLASGCSGMISASGPRGGLVVLTSPPLLGTFLLLTLLEPMWLGAVEERRGLFAESCFGVFVGLCAV